MSKETNKQTAEKLFATTAHDVLFANPKGEFFTSENTGSLSLKANEKLEKFERSPKAEANDEEAVYEFNAKDTISKIKEVTALEDLKSFATDTRKSVMDAVHKKQAELINALEVKASTVQGAGDQK